MYDESRLKEFIRGATRLPVLPKVTVRLLNALDSPESSPKDITEIIQSEPTLTTRLLKLANSSFYGQRGQVSTVRNAVVVLGAKTIRSLALAVWSHTLKSHARNTEELSLMEPVLTHSLASGVIARMLVERADKNLSEDAFMAGLLHDIGRVALVGQMGEEYRLWILVPAQQTHTPLHEMENQVLGFDHRALGSALIQSWMLPLFLVDIVEHHHDMDISPDTQLIAATVAMADYCATSFGYSLDLVTPRTQPEEVATFFGLRAPETLTEFMELCETKIMATNAALA